MQKVDFFMGQPTWQLLAQQVAAYYHQARRCHVSLRLLSQTAVVIDTAQDGTVLLRVPRAVWDDAMSDAVAPAPEPLNGPEEALSGIRADRGAHDNAPGTRATG